MEEARRQATREWQQIAARRKEIDQTDRPWNTPAGKAAWIKLRAIGLGGVEYVMPTSYTLTPEDIEEVEDHTRRVIAYNTAHRYKDNWEIGDESDYDLKFRGFAAEKAMSVLTGLPWRKIMFGSGFKEEKACDIGERTEVRNIRSPRGELTFKRKDSVHKLYMLTYGKPPNPVRFLGWLEGTDLVTYPWREPPAVKYPAHFAPQSVLHPFPLPSDA